MSKDTRKPSEITEFSPGARLTRADKVRIGYMIAKAMKRMGASDVHVFGELGELEMFTGAELKAIMADTYPDSILVRVNREQAFRIAREELSVILDTPSKSADVLEQEMALTMRLLENTTTVFMESMLANVPMNAEQYRTFIGKAIAELKGRS